MPYSTANVGLIFFVASFWTTEEVDLSKDMTDWEKLKVSSCIN